MDWSLIISFPVILLGVSGAALIAAGTVVYRGSLGVLPRALAAVTIAAGVSLWALIIFLTPVSVTRGETPSLTTTVSPASPTISLAETPAPGQHADWQQYRGDGFEFSYPAACSVTQRDGSFTVGGRVELVIADAKGLGLQDFVNQFIDERTRTNGWRPESRQEVLVGGNKAVRIDYRFGGTGRFGTATFVEQKQKIYIWGLTAGGFTCDEGSAFDDIVSSIRFTPPGSQTPTGR